MKKSNDKASTARRLKARYLIVMKGYSQVEAAKVVGVSNITVCVWYKKFNWKDAELKGVKRSGGMQVLFAEFMAYIKSREPNISDKVELLWKAFIEKLEENLNMGNKQ